MSEEAKIVYLCVSDMEYLWATGKNPVNRTFYLTTRVKKHIGASGIWIRFADWNARETINFEHDFCLCGEIKCSIDSVFFPVAQYILGVDGNRYGRSWGVQSSAGTTIMSKNPGWLCAIENGL